MATKTKKMSDIAEMPVLQYGLIDKDQLIGNIHHALDTYEVYVYNGKPEPIKKPLSEAITVISGDVRGLKKSQDVHTDLLSGMKIRKDFIDSFINVFSKTNIFFKIKPLWRLLIISSTALLTLMGVYKILQDYVL